MVKKGGKGSVGGDAPVLPMNTMATLRSHSCSIPCDSLTATSRLRNARTTRKPPVRLVSSVLFH